MRSPDYHYPPPSRSRKGQGSNLTVYKCVNCGRFGAHQIGPRRYRCLLCKSVVEYRASTENGDSELPLPA